MKSIPCTNPGCDSSVPISPDTDYAICPVCNTWHFISDNDRFEVGGLPVFEPLDTPLPFAESQEELQEAGLPAYEVYVSSAGNTITGSFAQTQQVAQPPEPGALISEAGDRYPLREGRNVIGRKDCDIMLAERSISRRHCVIEVSPVAEGQGWDYFLFDIGHIEASASANGTYITGRSLRLYNYERIPLRNGTEVQLGRIKLTLKL
jgi:hypothetical protein